MRRLFPAVLAIPLGVGLAVASKYLSPAATLGLLVGGALLLVALANALASTPDGTAHGWLSFVPRTPSGDGGMAHLIAELEHKVVKAEEQSAAAARAAKEMREDFDAALREAFEHIGDAPRQALSDVRGVRLANEQLANEFEALRDRLDGRLNELTKTVGALQAAQDETAERESESFEWITKVWEQESGRTTVAERREEQERLFPVVEVARSPSEAPGAVYYAYAYQRARDEERARAALDPYAGSGSIFNILGSAREPASEGRRGLLSSFGSRFDFRPVPYRRYEPFLSTVHPTSGAMAALVLTTAITDPDVEVRVEETPDGMRRVFIVLQLVASHAHLRHLWPGERRP